MTDRHHDHTALLARIRRDMPGEGRLTALAELFAVFGDPTRLRILYALFENEMCVCAISELLGMSPSAISHQLRVLREFSLVGNRREGKTVYYFLKDDHVRCIIAQGYGHLTEEKET